MGISCFPKTVRGTYRKQFEEANLPELKDQWPPLKKFQIKRIFERFAMNSETQTKSSIQNGENSTKSIQHRHNLSKQPYSYLTYQIFCQMFPQFIRYEAQQKKRIFDIFDVNQDGLVDWSDFYIMISICYYGDEKFLSILMFIIFDSSLDRKLDRTSLTLLLDLNAIYFRQNPNNNQFNFDNIKVSSNKSKKKKEQYSVIIGNKGGLQGTIKNFGSSKTIYKSVNTAKTIYDCDLVTYYEPEEIIESLIGLSETINLEKWVSQAQKYIDFNQFRRLFNIFKEQKLEKQLITNFSDWNDLYNEDQQRYVSYIVSYKWFENWKTYVEHEYGIHFNLSEKNPTTVKSLKTKKSFKTNNSSKIQRKLNGYKGQQLGIKKLELRFLSANKIRDNPTDNNFPEEIKNYDMISCIIGEKPEGIYNFLLEFQYEEVLKPGLIENRDFMFVSEKVWNYFRQIYDGFPEFRRTGFDQIELYPKCVKVYSSMFKGEIASATEVIRQVSNYTSIQDLMIGSLDISKKQSAKYNAYFRSPGMATWEIVKDMTCTFSSLTPHILVFLIYLEKKSQQIQNFEQKYLKESTNIKEINLGDMVIYTSPKKKKSNENKQENGSNSGVEGIFTNYTFQGKYMIHLIGKHYNHNLCLSHKQFLKSCKLKNKALKTTVSIAGTQKNPGNTGNNGSGIIKLNKASSLGKGQNVEHNQKSIQQSSEPSLKKSISQLYYDKIHIGFLISTLFHFNQNLNLRNILIPLSFKQKNSRQEFATLSLILGYLFNLLQKNTKVEPSILFSITEQYFPQFKNLNLRTCSLFLEEFIAKIFEELQESLSSPQLATDKSDKIKGLIKEQFKFELLKNVTCPECSVTTQEPIKDNIYVLNIPIPEKNCHFYEITFVPFCLDIMIQPKNARKFKFQLPKNSTFRDYKQKFEEVAHIKNAFIPYLLIQISENTIIKNFNHVDPQSSLESLHLREEDPIYAFEAYYDFEIFIRQHYGYSTTSLLSCSSQIKSAHKNSYHSPSTKDKSDKNTNKNEMSEDPIKIGQLLDCKNSKKGWIVGKVIEKDIMPYTYKQKVKVLHKYSKNQSYHVSYQVQRGIVSYFPLNSYRNCQVYHIRVEQRIFNEQFNEMRVCHLPFVCPLPNWMRYKQFQYLLYLQMQKFIHQEYRFYIIDEYQYSKNYRSQLYENRNKQSNKVRLRKFKEYLGGKEIPYKISFGDKNGRCSFCMKILKNNIFKGESQKYCEGCKLPKIDEPICWQIRITQLIVNVEWKDSHTIRPLEEIVKLDNSSKQLQQKKKMPNQTIQDYIQNYLFPEESEINEMVCCNKKLEMKYTRQFIKMPNILIVNLERIEEHNGFKQNIRQPVGISDQGLIVKNNNKEVRYELIGITSYQTIKRNLGFCTYIKQRNISEEDMQEGCDPYHAKDSKWTLYSGQKVLSCPTDSIDKNNTIIYYYKKIDGQQNFSKGEFREKESIERSMSHSSIKYIDDSYIEEEQLSRGSDQDHENSPSEEQNNEVLNSDEYSQYDESI